MKDCIFCKIINSEIPSYKVYEDEDVYAFLDISQTTPGHTLLIPKKHVKDIFAYDQTLAQKVLGKIPLIARALKKSLPNLNGLNLISNNGKIAGQAVFHSHFHFIPRYNEKDTFTLKFHDNSKNYSAEVLNKLAQSIGKQIKNEI